MDRYRTQWAAQFFAAAELTRRNYRVSLTLGNAPDIDLMVLSPKGAHFSIDVKGQASKNFWLIREREPKDTHYYMLVYVPCAPAKLAPPEFFIITSADAKVHITQLREKTVAAGRRWAASGAGINWGAAARYTDWGILPA